MNLVLLMSNSNESFSGAFTCIVPFAYGTLANGLRDQAATQFCALCVFSAYVQDKQQPPAQAPRLSNRTNLVGARAESGCRALIQYPVGQVSGVAEPELLEVKAKDARACPNMTPSEYTCVWSSPPASLGHKRCNETEADGWMYCKIGISKVVA